ncbi:MAG: AmmeMemoRadiSam system protein B [Kiritimatiellaeota bacterium]|nr:AmmeMemoRadiSam system protein B [Kiritimatiellota bacterium]
MIKGGGIARCCFVAVLAAGLLVSCREGKDMNAKTAGAGAAPKQVMQASLAGQWYSDQREELTRELQHDLEQAGGAKLPDVIALIQPHAGYRFSGPAVAYGARQVQGKTFRRVVVIGASHRRPLPNTVCVPTATHYATPLGELPLDRDFIAALQQFPFVRRLPAAFEEENSVEMQIPMLQQALGTFTLVPVVVGQLDPATIREVAQALGSLVDAGTLVVASTDFTHYGAQYGYVPFTTNIAENLRKLDLGAVELIEKKDLEGFNAYCARTGATICGQVPVSILLALLPPAAQAHLLKYDTSGAQTGDFGMSVSYVSLAFTGAWPPAPEKKEATLGAEDQKQLLRLARQTLEYHFLKNREATPADLGIEITAAMRQTMGAFVTLKERGELRGCIGEIFPKRPLFEAVMDHARNAALHDPRFRPVAAVELPQLEFEISALTPPRPVASYHEIVIGRHGMVLTKRGRSAVFLPQVAPEQGWDLPITLTYLAQKAGLRADDWKEGAEYLVFEAIVFHEKK